VLVVEKGPSDVVKLLSLLSQFLVSSIKKFAEFAVIIYRNF